MTLDTQNDELNTPLHLAAQSNSREIVSLLLAANCNYGIKNQ